MFSLFAVATSSARVRYGTSPCMGPGCRNAGNMAIQYKFEYLQGRLSRYSRAIRGMDVEKNWTRGAEFAVEFPQLGGSPWTFYWNFPTIGAAVQYMNFGNKDYLGDSFTFYPYLYLPLIKTKATQLFSINLKIGAGVSFITKKYDMNLDNRFVNGVWDENRSLNYSTNNYCIGSTANVYLTGGLNFDLRFSKKNRGFWSRWGLLGEVVWNHYSNANIRKSDEGLDALNMGVGLRYIPYFSACPMRAGLDRLPRKWYFEPELTFGVNRKHETDTKLYPTATLSVGAHRPLLNIYRIGFSVDAFYNTAFNADRTLPVYYDSENASPFRMGVSLANNFLFGKFMAGLQVGLYLINKQVERDGHCYLRLSARYNVWDNLYVVTALKSHKSDIETLELGVAYSLSKKEKAPYSWLPEKKKKSPKSKIDKEESKTTKKDEVPMGKKAKKLSK